MIHTHNLHRLIRSLTLPLMLAVALSGFSAFAVAEDKPSGSIKFEVYKAGLIVGVSGGSGTLTYKGKSYPLSIGGISLGATIGVSKAEFVGDVFHLTAAGDIAGVYSGTQAGVAIAGGPKVAELKNAQGVVLKVSGEQIGVELSLDLNGMEIKLKE